MSAKHERPIDYRSESEQPHGARGNTMIAGETLPFRIRKGRLRQTRWGIRSRRKTYRGRATGPKNCAQRYLFSI